MNTASRARTPQSVAALRQIVREALTCPTCGKLRAREQVGDTGMTYAPEPFSADKHCACAPHAYTVEIH